MKAARKVRDRVGNESEEAKESRERVKVIDRHVQDDSIRIHNELPKRYGHDRRSQDRVRFKGRHRQKQSNKPHSSTLLLLIMDKNGLDAR